jgi:hypothetical protein
MTSADPSTETCACAAEELAAKHNAKQPSFSSFPTDSKARSYACGKTVPDPSECPWLQDSRPGG